MSLANKLQQAYATAYSFPEGTDGRKKNIQIANGLVEQINHKLWQLGQIKELLGER